MGEGRFMPAKEKSWRDRKISPMARLMEPEFASEAVGSFGNDRGYVACAITLPFSL